MIIDLHTRLSHLWATSSAYRFQSLGVTVAFSNKFFGFRLQEVSLFPLKTSIDDNSKILRGFVFFFNLLNNWTISSLDEESLDMIIISIEDFLLLASIIARRVDFKYYDSNLSKRVYLFHLECYRKSPQNLPYYFDYAH